MNTMNCKALATKVTDVKYVTTMSKRGHREMRDLHNSILETFETLLNVVPPSTPFQVVYEQFVGAGFLVGDKTKQQLKVIYDMNSLNLKNCQHEDNY